MQIQILNVCLGIIDNIIIFLFADKIFKKRYSYKIFFYVSIIICSVIVFVIGKYNIFVKAIISVIELTIVFSILYKEKIYVKTAFVAVFLYFLYIIDIVAGNLFSFIYDEQILNLFYSSFLNRVTVCSVIKLFNALAFVILYKMFAKIDFEISAENWLLFNIIVAVFIIISIIFMYNYGFYESDRNSSAFFFSISFAFFIMSFIVVYFFTKLCSNFQKEKRMYVLESSNKSMKNSIAVQNQTNLKLQKIRHDIKNHLKSVLFFLNSKNYDDAEKLLKSVSNNVNNIGLELEQTTGNSLIDSIISYEKAICENRNINFSYSLELLPKLDIDMVDLSSVLSNLLDNSIEAAQKSDVSIVEIKVFTYKLFLTIMVTNTFLGEVTVDNEQLITNKSNSLSHGFGTQIIKEICERYNGKYSWYINEGLFTSTVILENRI